MSHATLLPCHQRRDILNFSAVIRESIPLPDGRAYQVRLDESYFFPAGGGQPADRGSINGIAVVDVINRDGQIWHVTAQDPGSGQADCVIDEAWRSHFMRQHSGQHIISGALWQTARIQTLSVHLGEELTTIETDAAEIGPELIFRVEDLANDIVRQNLPIEVIAGHSEQAGSFPLRKPPPLEGPINLVSVGRFDCSVCCGLHLISSGEVGLIKYLDSEKIRNHARTGWLIGRTATLDYRNKHHTIQQLKNVMSCKLDELPGQISGLQEENRRLHRELSALETRLAALLADRLLADQPAGAAGLRIVSGLFSEPESLLGQLVKALLNHERLVFCIVNRTEKQFTWSIGCSADIEFDFNGLRERLLTPFAAKGGGRPPLWKGSSPRPDLARCFLDSFCDTIPGLAAIKPLTG